MCGRASHVSLMLLVVLVALPVVQTVDVAVAIQEAAVLLPAVGRVLDEAVGSVLGSGLSVELPVRLAVGVDGCRAVGPAVGNTLAETPAGGSALEPLGEVGVLVEVPEEEPEHDGVEANPPHEATGVVAVRPEQELE